MIINARRTSLDFGTDAVAASVRSALATAAPAARERAHDETGRPGSQLDLAALYPALFAEQARAPRLVSALRPLVVRLSVGAAAILVALAHHA